VTRKTIDHGDVVETRYTILTSPDDPDMVVLRPDLVPDAVERENVYFLRRFKDGQLCDGHLHKSLDEALACTDRTKLDALWQDLARIMADIQRQVNAEYVEYRKNGGTLGGDEWLEQRNEERNKPPKRRRVKASAAVHSASSARPTLARMAGKKKGEPKAGALGPLPSQTNAELAQAIVRAGLSVVPAGGAIAELLAFLQPTFGRRRDVWLQELADGFEDLKDRLDAAEFEALRHNELFVTVVFNATQAAMRTHQPEKLEALRAAVVNSALPMAPDEHTQLMFIRFVDELTALHLRVLSYYRDPAGWFARHDIARPDMSMGPRSAIMEAALPDLRGQSEVYGQVMRELSARGLVHDTTGMVSAQALYDPQTTSTGNRFLDFITAPPLAHE